jgi:hypothetical protein
MPRKVKTAFDILQEAGLGIKLEKMTGGLLPISMIQRAKYLSLIEAGFTEDQALKSVTMKILPDMSGFGG